MSPARRRLIVFARVPERGRVKTRLAAVIGDDEALAVHRELLARTLSIAAAARADERELCIAGDDRTGECETLARTHGLRLSRQRGADLGERMSNAIHDALADGCVAVLIGSDCPVLEAGDLDDAFERLSRGDAVLAPTEDGGYALIGLSRRLPGVFVGPVWGGAEVLATTRRHLRAAGARWHELRQLWDVDDYDDYLRWKARRPGR